MKKLTIVLLTACLFLSQNSMALEATGVIEDVRVCATGNTSGARWVRTLLFKVDGNWFGVKAEYYAHANNYDNEITPSLVMMAFSSDYTVEVRATDSWDADGFSNCGIAEGAILHDNAGDYLHINR